MFEFLADPVWQFLIGAVIAIATIVISIIIHLKQRNHKSLSYEILSNTDLLSVEEQTKNDIQLSQKGKIVEKVRLVVLRISNSGNLPVVSADYEKPISIEFGKENHVLTAEVIKKCPNNLQSAISIEDHNVNLYPTLLNPADSITTKILVTNYETGLVVNSRIVGISEIEVLKTKSLVAVAFLGIFLGMAISVLGSLVWSTLFGGSFFQAFTYFNIVYYVFFVAIGTLFSVDQKVRQGLNKGFNVFLEESDDKKKSCE